MAPMSAPHLFDEPANKTCNADQDATNSDHEIDGSLIAADLTTRRTHHVTQCAHIAIDLLDSFLECDALGIDLCLQECALLIHAIIADFKQIHRFNALYQLMCLVIHFP